MSPDSCAGNVIYDDDDQSRIQALHPKSATGLEAKSPSCTTRCSRPGVARAAASAALLVATTLLLSGAHSLPTPFDYASDAAGVPLSKMHPDCFNNARGRPAGVAPARRGECWEAFGMQRPAKLPWWQALLHPFTWWKLRSSPIPQQEPHGRKAADVIHTSKVGRKAQSSDNAEWVSDGRSGLASEDAEAWTSFNESSMAQIFSQDVAWMMHREMMYSVIDEGAQALQAHVQEERARSGNRSHPKFEPELAISLAHLQSIAYCDPVNVRPWNCTRCHKSEAATGFQLYSMIDDVPWDLRAFVGYAPLLRAKVVAFRGTDSHSWYNWAENMRTWRVDLQLPYPGAEGSLVHSGPPSQYCLVVKIWCTKYTGFFYSYNLSSLQPNVSAAGAALELQYPGEPWYIIGHSMGAAMATVAALDLRYSLHPQPDVRLYTFGSPRVGNDIFANFFKTAIQESYRFTHNRDIVPSVPLQIMGFHHIAREVPYACTIRSPCIEVWLLTFEAGPNIISMCNESGEDPACHNSVCYLGLCTSIVDHMNYLGGHMYHRNPIGC